MQRLSALMPLAAALLLAGCGPGANEAAGDANNAAEPAPANIGDGNATLDSNESAANATAEAGAVINQNYSCEPAMEVAVSYDNGDPDHPRARVTLAGVTHDMSLVPSGSGARYATPNGRTPGRTLVWWNKGRDGTLLEGDAANPAAPENVIANCTEAP